MQFYSGFSFCDESSLFQEYLDTSDLSIAGFSYGAIAAFLKAQENLKNNIRVDKLQLFSPAFFQTKNEKFKKLQLMGYRRSSQNYLEEFRKLCYQPYKEKKILKTTPTKLEELEELLFFQWRAQDIQQLVDRGVNVEVYLGGRDHIIDVEAARVFFKERATLIYIKNANHMLQTN
jgi:glycosyltransferase involved in cell wall biosynthesis